MQSFSTCNSSISKLIENDRLTKTTSLFQTLNDCFLEVKKCTTSRRNWLASRKAFIVSAKKTNRSKNLGLNLDKCDFKLSKDPKDSDDMEDEEVEDKEDFDDENEE